jgi:hypothetical protein
MIHNHGAVFAHELVRSFSIPLVSATHASFLAASCVAPLNPLLIRWI